MGPNRVLHRELLRSGSRHRLPCAREHNDGTPTGFIIKRCERSFPAWFGDIQRRSKARIHEAQPIAPDPFLNVELDRSLVGIDHDEQISLIELSAAQAPGEAA